MSIKGRLFLSGFLLAAICAAPVVAVETGSAVGTAPAKPKAAKPAAKKAAPKKPSAAKAAAPAKATPPPPAEVAKPAEQTPPAAPAAAEESMDVTIRGEVRDEIPLTKPAAEASISFDQVAGLSREGQTDRVLSGPIVHMSGQDQMGLLKMESRQAFLGLPVRIPAPPFVRMEISPGLSPSSWELQVLDQNDKIIKALSGASLPKYVLEWDGFLNEVLHIRPGPAYTPVLVLTDDRKRMQRYFGEPVHFAALQYSRDGVLHIEFDNNRLFERGRAEFSSDMTPYLAASLDLLRRNGNGPVRVTLYAPPSSSQPVQRRLENLKTFYRDALSLEGEMMIFSVQPAKERGEVTEISVKSQE